MDTGFSRRAGFFVGLLGIVATAAEGALVVPPAHLKAAEYAEWAHSHWIWPGSCAADQPCKNQEGILRLITEFIEHDLPVGNINVDSGWETNYNSFIIDETAYPDMAKLIADVHALGSHITFWMTGHINMESENYQYAKDHNYLLNGGQLVPWWHGDGALIDLTNPEAVEWYKQQLNVVLDLGADGWKLDTTDPYVYFLYPAINYQGRPVTKEQYSDLYYRTFYEHSLSKNPEALIMSRPVDALPPGLKRTLRIPFTPIDICVAGWVGDQDPTFEGMQAAMINMFASAEYTYVNFGSDIGGFRSDTGSYGPNGRTKELFLRWAQMGALVPLMENGGNNEHRPWIFDEETLEIYRVFAHLHEELTPFWYSHATEAFAGGYAVMQPQGKCFWRPGEDAPFPDPCPYEYKLADDIFVSPIVQNATTRVVNFPAGDQWVDWWDGLSVFNGSTSEVFNVPLSTMPLFRRVGSVIPLRVANAYNGHNFGGLTTKTLPSLMTLLVTHPFDANSQFGTIRVHEPTGPGLDMRFSIDGLGRSMQLSLTASDHPVLMVISGFNNGREVERIERLVPVCEGKTSASSLEKDCKTFEPLHRTTGFIAPSGVDVLSIKADEHDLALFKNAKNVAFKVNRDTQELFIFVPAGIAGEGAIINVDTTFAS